MSLLAVLSAEPADQLAWAAGHEVLTEAIVFDFDLVLRQAEALELGAVPDLRSIDLLFGEMKVRDHSGLWADTLAADPRWDEVRTAARRALVRMCGDWRQPLPARVLR
ncbi:hypothetical protein ACFQ6N_01380 [Kitasatospora sp. NPDC056446]|uniref:hypothetical protein n=1 Tax=Kitasatospora sp. NPDC056446 TaxID=3345819 RepID=UPI0036971432